MIIKDHPISLMWTPAKIYERLSHLPIWISENNILGEKQAGFSKKYLEFHYLVYKYVKRQKSIYSFNRFKGYWLKL